MARPPRPERRTEPPRPERRTEPPRPERRTEPPRPESVATRFVPRATCQLKEPPQAQELPAFGLSIVKPCFSMVSAKSIVAPSR
ncbi:hypothetical protein GCM10023221_28010 [Luteimicrobium xylanilyticum]